MPSFRQQCGSPDVLDGTDLMHGVVHRLNQQSVPSDHTAAARYGNALGDAIAKQVMR